jgi:hypothetical protein
MLPELAAAASVFVLILAIIGYLLIAFYERGYYANAYQPSKNKGAVEDFVGHAARGFIAFFGIMGIALFLMAKMFTMPDYIAYIPISPENAGYLALFLYVFFILSLSTLIAMSLAGLWGRYDVAYSFSKVIIERKEQEPLEVREVYDQDDDFYYYLDFEGDWASIRKGDVKSMRYAYKGTIVDGKPRTRTNRAIEWFSLIGRKK